jgi:RimJ/RimL family protein N-acetyltransferase
MTEHRLTASRGADVGPPSPACPSLGVYAVTAAGGLQVSPDGSVADALIPAIGRDHAGDAASTPAAQVPRRRPRAADRRVRLRPLEQGEAAPLLEIFAGLSARSREQRFLSPKHQLTDADLRRLTNVDGHDRVALVAEMPEGRPIGVARFVRNPDGDSADVAVTVIDDRQGEGVGTLLASSLAEHAQQVGIRRFTLMMSHGNEAALRLTHRFSGKARCLTVDRYAAHFTVTLPNATC